MELTFALERAARRSGWPNRSTRGPVKRSNPGANVSRPRQFDENKALDAAIACFWRYGLEATSVRDLTGEMGINGPSLYNAFGDKRALFSAALERYVTLRVRERIGRIEREHLAREALDVFFREVIDQAVSDPEQRGCMLVNAALGLAPDDDVLRPQIAGYFAEIEEFFERALTAIGQRPGGRLAVSPHDGARMLVSMLIGLRVLARVRPDHEVLDGVMRGTLSAIDGQSLSNTGSEG